MVLFPNADITIYNRYFDKLSGLDKYQRTVIRNVDWQHVRNTTAGKTVLDKGVLVKDSTLIFINKVDNYVTPKNFAKLSDAERPGYFTFNVSDKIVKGEIDHEVTLISELEKMFDDVVTFVSIRDPDSHWEVECE